MKNYPLEELTERFTQHLEVIRNYTQATIRGYKDAFRMLRNSTNIVYLEDFNKHAIEKFFFNGRLERKWSPVTFWSYHKRFNVFAKWLVKEGYIEHNFVDEMEKPRLEQKLPKTLSKDEGQLILDASFHIRYTYKYERYRNRAIIGVMLLAGLRRGEVKKLLFNDVSIEQKSIFVRQGKGQKDRVIPINSLLKKILVEYLKDRRRLKKESLSFFTAVQKDNPIGDHCISIIIDRIRKKTKLKFSAHTLRHAFARLMLEGGCDIYTLSKIMGHNKITTTTIYLSCSNQQMSKSIEMHSLN